MEEKQEIEDPLNSKCKQADIYYKDLVNLSWVDFLLNKFLLLEYIEWIRNNRAHKNLEALFNMFFLELQDLSRAREIHPSKFMDYKIGRFKFAIAMILVKCEYHYIIYYILKPQGNSKSSKINLDALRKEAVDSKLFKSSAFNRVIEYPLMWELKEFHPCMSLDISLLMKWFTFMYRLFSRLERIGRWTRREAILSKVYRF